MELCYVEKLRVWDASERCMDIQDVQRSRTKVKVHPFPRPVVTVFVMQVRNVMLAKYKMDLATAQLPVSVSTVETECSHLASMKSANRRVKRFTSMMLMHRS